jgi:hypothetical protein
VSAEVLRGLSAAYEAAEAQALKLVRDRADRLAVAAAMRRVATAAADFNSEAYRKFHASEEDAWMPLDHLSERTEVLAELWVDLARAYEA